MKKLALHVLAGAALLSGPAYAFGGGPQAAAAAYCAARDAGGSHDAGIKNMSAQLVSGFSNTSITSMFATLTVSGKETVQTSMYLAKQMCPEHFRPYATIPTTTKPVWANKASDYSYGD